jgi:hypothetical protein
MAHHAPWLKAHRWKKGQSGNPGGATKGLTRLLRELMGKREINGTKLPNNKTVEQVFVENFVGQALKGSAAHALQIWDRLEGRINDQALAEAAARTIYEIIDNGRDQKPISLPPADDEQVIDVTGEVIDVTEEGNKPNKE